MRNGHDQQVELDRQLDRVRRRVDETVARLARARGGLTVEWPGSVPAAEPATRRGDLFLLCIHLEVALAESAEAADKLAAGLRELAASHGPPPSPPPRPSPPPQPALPQPDARDPAGGAVWS